MDFLPGGIFLVHDQAERVRAKVAKSEETTSPNEINMDTPQKSTAETAQKPKGPFPEVPTTKILAIGRFTTRPTPEQIKEFFPREVPDTLRLIWLVRSTSGGFARIRQAPSSS
jgi:hypothetical protein